ncbi:hypothetical protein Dimus_033491 [Dionaea muscipula]
MVRAYPSRLLLDDGSKAGGSYSSTEANFNGNMVIILAALLGALICALGLNSILRCALRCNRRLAFRRGEAAGRLAAGGLKKRMLRRIPIATYSADMNIRTRECIICLGEFLEGERVRVLPKCKHGFHVMCIDAWLLLHSSCPTCRQSPVVDVDTTSDGVDCRGTEYGDHSHENVFPIVVIEAS